MKEVMTAVLASCLAKMKTRGRKIISYPHDINSWQIKIYQNSGYKKNMCLLLADSLVTRAVVFTTQKKLFNIFFKLLCIARFVWRVFEIAFRLRPPATLLILLVIGLGPQQVDHNLHSQVCVGASAIK